MVTPFLIGTRNASPHLHTGVEVLRRGGSTLDAVEATVTGIEEDPESGNVGAGGSPNILGVTQLDASIMDGRTLRTGAVAAVSRYVNAISIARKVMEETPHVFLVGEGAHRFAKTMGFREWDLSTERTRAIFDALRRDAFEELPDGFRGRERYIEYAKNSRLREWYERLSDEQHGTTNVIGMDAEGNICVGVSTSGTSLKFPGRLGDSPIIGAGNYCDNRYGGVACTGRGELTIRLLTARMIVSHMADGMGLEEAVNWGLKEIHALNEFGGVQCIAVDRSGNTLSTSTRGESTHWYMDIGMEAPEERQGLWVKP